MWQDLKYGFRNLVQSPVLAMVAIASVALGIGLNVCVFGVFESMFIHGVTAADPDHTYHLWIGGGNRTSYSTLIDLREANAVADLAGYTLMQFSLGEGDSRRKIYGQAITGNYFEMLGVIPSLGRTFLDSEKRPEFGTQVAVLSYPFWQQQYQGSRDVLGKRLLLNGKPFIIVGVLPVGYRSIHGLALEPPFYVPYSSAVDSAYQMRDSYSLELVIRTRPGQTKGEASAALLGAAKRIQRLHPDLRPEFAQVRVFGISVLDRLQGQGGAKQMLVFFAILSAIVALILLMACANVAALLLARAANRRREISVRLALGASRLQIMRLFVAEGLVLASAGLLASAFLYANALDGLSRITLPVEVPFYLRPETDWRMAAYCAMITVATTMLCSLGPALEASRTTISPGLKKQDEARSHSRLFSLRNNLVIAQIAGSLVLLMISLLFVRSLLAVQTVDPGFNVNNQLIAEVHLDEPSPSIERRAQVLDQAMDRLKNVPGVQSVSAAAIVPLSNNSWMTSVRIGNDASREPVVQADALAPAFFQTMGVRFLAGRDFSPSDTKLSANVAIVNRAFVNRYLAPRNPLGEIVTVGSPKSRQRVEWQIVGVVEDSKYISLGEMPTPIIYRPLTQEWLPPVTPAIHVRTAPAAASLASVVRAALLQVAPRSTVTVKTMQENMEFSTYPNKLGAALLGSMGLLGLILASIGLYGVLAFTVAQRTREIGIRIALGGSRTQVLCTILRQAALVVAIGLTLGLSIAAIAVQSVRSFISASIAVRDPVSIGMVVLLLGTTALLAAIVPARRALSVAPIDALRYE